MRTIDMDVYISDYPNGVLEMYQDTGNVYSEIWIHIGEINSDTTFSGSVLLVLNNVAAAAEPLAEAVSQKLVKMHNTEIQKGAKYSFHLYVWLRLDWENDFIQFLKDKGYEVTKVDVY